MKERFRANQGVRSEGSSGLVVAFGEELEDGTVLHSLMLLRDEDHAGPPAVYLEFDGPDNACTGESLDDIRRGDDRITIVFGNRSRIRPGAVNSEGVALPRELEVRLDIPAENLGGIREGLESILVGGCPSSYYVGRALGKR